MKFPLAQLPFPPLQLSLKQCEAFESLTGNLLQETLGEFDHFVHVQNRMLSKKHWKSVKKRENVTVYKHRHEGAASTATNKSHSTASTTSSSDSNLSRPMIVTRGTWSLPKMLAVGTIVGTLEDVMYGIISPDEDAIKVKTTYVQDELIDGRVLVQLQHPTVDDPFRFLAVKWFVKAHPASVNAVVWPRDLVFIEGTGYHRLPDGDVIGYHLLHSVMLPECPELTHMGIMRCEFASCFLFKGSRNSTVEVYMKSHVEPCGTIPDIVAVISSANALIGCWKSVWCAQNKKLAWMMQQAALARAQQHAVGDDTDEPRRMIVRTTLDGKKCCALCVKHLAPFHRTIACDLCRSVVCNRCRTARKLTYVRRTGDVKIVPTVVCKNCITQSTQLSSAEVALRESKFPHLQRQRPRRRSTARPAAAMAAVHPEFTELARRSLSPSAGALSAGTCVGRHSVPPISLLEEAMDVGDVSIETIDEWERQLSQASLNGAVDDADASTPEPSPGDESRQHEDLWKQMNELWVKAERTYQLTRRNTKVIQGLQTE